MSVTSSAGECTQLKMMKYIEFKTIILLTALTQVEADKRKML